MECMDETENESFDSQLIFRPRQFFFGSAECHLSTIFPAKHLPRTLILNPFFYLFTRACLTLATLIPSYFQCKIIEWNV